jgi:hypothetical protein
MHPLAALPEAPSRLGEPPASYYAGKTLVEYLMLWANHLAAKAAAGAVTGLHPICQDYGPARGYLVNTSSGRRFVLDCDSGQTWAELVETGGGELPPAPAPKTPTDAEVLAQLGNAHLFLDPGVSLPVLRPGAPGAGLVARSLPGYSVALYTPQHTYLFRAAPGAPPRLAWGPKPQPAGAWENVGTLGNSTLWQPRPGAGAVLPESKATFTKESLIDGKKALVFNPLLWKPTVTVFRSGFAQEAAPPVRAPAPRVGQ